jgi:hypothetical protein
MQVHPTVKHSTNTQANPSPTMDAIMQCIMHMVSSVHFINHQTSRGKATATQNLALVQHSACKLGDFTE